MQNNYFFLRQLTLQLKNKLLGYVLGTCFSQEKDEVIFGFWIDGKEFYLKVVLQPSFATLTFPTDFQRAKKNSANLFKDLIGNRICDIKQLENERSFVLVFENGYQLLFKMHGNRSNIILFKDDDFVEMFHNKLIADKSLKSQSLNRPLIQNFEAFKNNEFNVSKIYPTFGKLINNYVENQQYDSVENKWKKITEIVEILNTPTFYITLIKGIPVLSLIPVGEIIFETEDAIEAANKFYSYYTQISVFDKEKNQVINSLEKKKSKTESYILKTNQKLLEVENESGNGQLANILMANLHSIKPDSQSVELFDFYNDRNIIIKLKNNFSAQKNAEIYYRKAKNLNVELDKLKENLLHKKNELLKVVTQINEIQELENFKDLRKYLKENNLSAREVEISNEEELFKKYKYLDFDILVGRNAKNNDLLTQKYAHKDDLWLHAKDVKGSHVVIKFKSGKKIPDVVIEKAAQLAAFFSKRKTDSLCPVIVTPKKFVRKTKGLAEGQVIVEKESVVMVVPEDWK